MAEKREENVNGEQKDPPRSPSFTERLVKDVIEEGVKEGAKHFLSKTSWVAKLLAVGGGVTVLASGTVAAIAAAPIALPLLGIAACGAAGGAMGLWLAQKNKKHSKEGDSK